MAAVGADRQLGAHLERARRRARPHADNARILLDDIGHLGLRAQAKCRASRGTGGEEIEELPLRHEGDELASGRQVREIGDRDDRVADPSLDLAQLLMRSFKEAVEQAELVHHFEGRGMNRIAAEVAQEIRVLLQHHDVDAGASEQQAEHHPGRPAASDAAAGTEHFLAFVHIVSVSSLIAATSAEVLTRA